MYRKLLVPVDGSETGNRALDQAAELAASSGAEVRLLHIVDVLSYANGFERPEVYLRQVLPAMRRAGEDILRQSRERLERRGVASDCQLEQCRDRRVSEIIVEMAGRWGADLIVMGTHGRRGIDRLLMGSDAEGVARTWPVPVLLVRPAAAAGA